MNTQSLDRYMIDVSDERHEKHNVEILFADVNPITNRFVMRSDDRSKVDQLIDIGCQAGWMERTPTGARMLHIMRYPNAETIEITLGMQGACCDPDDREWFRSRAECELSQMTDDRLTAYERWVTRPEYRKPDRRESHWYGGE